MLPETEKLMLITEKNGKAVVVFVYCTLAEKEMVLRRFESLSKAFITQSGYRIAKDTIMGFVEPLTASQGYIPFLTLRERLALRGLSVKV